MEAHYAQAQSAFLNAWLEGVKIVGESWFTFNPTFCQKAESLNEAKSKWQVMPNYELVNERIGVLSGGEVALLAAMRSFYNAEWGGKLMQDGGLQGLADLSGKLDLQGNRIIAELMINYTGW
ncbi:MAG: hypothetical protein OQL06_00860 [Gammaproteobacteria bacterium]|nr:hypothetical protein [Gammaproteobacteria bacterium]